MLTAAGVDAFATNDGDQISDLVSRSDLMLNLTAHGCGLLDGRVDATLPAADATDGRPVPRSGRSLARRREGCSSMLRVVAVSLLIGRAHSANSAGL
jgi:hypothetical protein